MLNFHDWLNEYNNPRKGMKSRWSVKYKKSINCANPKGFSQKNYCKRKKRGGKYIHEEFERFAGKEDVDFSKIDAVYNKSDLAVKLVQMYDAQSGNKFLTGITTITPIYKNDIYGLYNSAENRSILGTYDTQKFQFSKDDIEKIKSMPKSVLKQHGVPDEILNKLQTTDNINVNVLKIYNDFNKQYKAGVITAQEAQLKIIIEIAKTIIHERKHDLERRDFENKGIPSTGESGPEKEEQKFENWFNANKKSIISQLPQLMDVNIK